MAASKLTVVLSQSPGKVPAKRHLEEEIAAALLMEPNVAVSLVPHLYDLPADDSGLLFLRNVGGDLVVLSWLFPRACRWILDRQNVKGQIGLSLLDRKPDEDEDDEEEPAAPSENGIGSLGAPSRRVYCLDLRDHAEAKTYIDEVKRIARDASTPVVTLGGLGSPSPANGTNGAFAVNGIAGIAAAKPNSPAPLNLLAPKSPVLAIVEPTPTLSYDGRNSDQPGRRRWYPVIDYSRCTNCMECIDFCLFGVYGVDGAERILVEQQDNCKKGCPACSRVCPENAIIFPEYKSPAIAGAAVGEAAGVKIDLSKLFGGGGPADGGDSAIDLAVQERDRELVAAGRDAVGAGVGLPKRQALRAAAPRDELDDLLDGLDDLDL